MIIPTWSLRLFECKLLFSFSFLDEINICLLRVVTPHHTRGPFLRLLRPKNPFRLRTPFTSPFDFCKNQYDYRTRVRKRLRFFFFFFEFVLYCFCRFLFYHDPDEKLPFTSLWLSRCTSRLLEPLSRPSTSSLWSEPDHNWSTNWTSFSGREGLGNTGSTGFKTWSSHKWFDEIKKKTGPLRRYGCVVNVMT